MTESQFDPNQFLEQEQTDAMETEYKPVPEGVYTVMIFDNPDNDNQRLTIRPVNTKNGVGYVMDIPMQIDAPGNEEAHQKNVRWSSFIDFTPENGFEFGPNKNVKLGQVRAAVGQNEPGKPWRPTDLIGEILQAKVEHDSEGKYANVTEVAALT